MHLEGSPERKKEELLAFLQAHHAQDAEIILLVPNVLRVEGANAFMHQELDAATVWEHDLPTDSACYFENIDTYPNRTWALWKSSIS